MAELYHLHLKGNQDEKWKEKKELNITPDFTNRLGKKVKNFNDCTTRPELNYISNYLNIIFGQNGYQTFSRMPLYLIIDTILDPNNKIDPKTQRVILEEARRIAFTASILKREAAMEEYRQLHKAELPSRMHCVYATTENGIEYWSNLITDNDVDILRIETLEEPFKTSELFIPTEDSTYEEMFSNSFRYWNPKFKNIPEETSEYLIKGKIKVLEKVGEIKRPR